MDHRSRQLALDQLTASHAELLASVAGLSAAATTYASISELTTALDNAGYTHERVQ